MITKLIDMQIINGGQTTASLAEAILKRTNVNLDGIFVPMKLTVIEDRDTENEEGIRFYDEMVQAIARYANSQNKVTAADLFSNEPFHIWMEKISKKHLAAPKHYTIPTGWYYERSRKRYQQEQLKLRGDELKRFLAKFPKKQIINKEQLAIYYTAVIKCEPHIVSKGKNWAMKEFGTAISEEFRTKRETFNEFYFERCICAAIIFRTIDNYLERNKDSARNQTGFWYKVGGYKLNIVPYTIAKILSAIPKGYSLNWKKIWDQQMLSSAFMQSTWETFCTAVPYEPSHSFIGELVPESMMKEIEKDAKKDQKEINELQTVMDMIAKGAAYWNALLTKGASLISFQEQAAITQIINMAITGNIPSSKSGKLPSKTVSIVKAALAAENRIISEGISV